MSNKPYSAFFKVGKDENLVEVRQIKVTALVIDQKNFRIK